MGMVSSTYCPAVQTGCVVVPVTHTPFVSAPVAPAQELLADVLYGAVVQVTPLAWQRLESKNRDPNVTLDEPVFRRTNWTQGPGWSLIPPRR